MATRTDTLRIRLEQEGEGRVRASLASVSRSVDDVEARLDSMTRIARSAGAALLAGFSIERVAAGIRAVGQAAIEAERTEARLEAVLRATGSAAGFTAEQLFSVAEQLEALTEFDGEAIKEAMATLLTFRDVSGEAFTSGIRLAADLATVFKTDLRTAAQQMGRALNDPLEGLSALSRLGIRFSEAQGEMVRRMMEAGRVAEAQGVILEALQARIGGAAAGQNVGLVKSTSDLADAWNDFLEALGRTPAVQRSAQESMGFIERFLRDATTVLNPSLAQQRIRLINEFQRARAIAEDPNIQRLDPKFAARHRAEMEALIEQINALDELIIAEERRKAAERDRAEQAQRAAAAEREREAAAEAARRRQIEWIQFQRETEYQAFVDWQREQAEREALEAEIVERERLRIESEYDDLRTAAMDRLKLLEEEYAEKRRIVQEYLSWHPEAQAEANQILLDLENDYQTERAEIERQANDSIIALRFAVVQQLGGLLQTLAGQSKAAAIAVIAIEKGLAIAQTIMNTEVAAMRALAELGPIAGPPMAAKIKALGQISVGIIAATGFLQAANVGAGGAALGTPGNPIITQPPATPIFDPNEQRGAGSSIVVQFLGPVLGEEEFVRTRMAPILRELIENEQLVIITSGSRQAQEILGTV